MFVTVYIYYMSLLEGDVKAQLSTSGLVVVLRSVRVSVAMDGDQFELENKCEMNKNLQTCMI